MQKNGLCPSFVYYIKQIDAQQDISFYFHHLNTHNLCHTMNELRCSKKSYMIGPAQLPATSRVLIHINYAKHNFESGFIINNLKVKPLFSL